MSANFTQIQRYFFTKIKKDDTPVDEQKYYILDEGNYTDLLSWNGFLIAVKGKHVYFFNYYNDFSSYEGGLYIPTVIDPWSITAPLVIPSSIFLRVYCRCGQTPQKTSFHVLPSSRHIDPVAISLERRSGFW